MVPEKPALENQNGKERAERMSRDEITKDLMCNLCSADYQVTTYRDGSDPSSMCDCGVESCLDCKVRCYGCGDNGCGSCFKKGDLSGEWFCSDCDENDDG